ncbi:camelysin [Bacillus oleivorans]|uniref:Camelysin n=1 Tax=Bacillus oleivorans TaxID=1448271 RepID=A0A285CTH3_9BACI|nr:TasA family protein [Bacillus oleivorans]SNX70356.1 camelysin [Bacillus oleivorans]
MSLKKKLTMGALSATLGMSLVGAGTWAAFNDIEEVNASLAAGSLDLVVDEYNGPVNFNISNLKPGDTMTRYIKLDNAGTLAIKDVLLSIDSVNFTDYLPVGADSDIYGANTADEYLSQFKVTLLKTGIEGADEEIISSADNITLADIYLATNPDQLDPVAIAKLSAAIGNGHWVDGHVNLASAAQNQWTGLPVNPADFDTVEMSIEFVEYSIRDARGVEEQNKYQGDTADITFTLEARQWEGQDVSDEEGYVESNEQARNGQ